MTSLSFVILILAITSTVLATTAACGGSARLLEVESLNKHSKDECDPAHTCRFGCECGESVYFDMRTWRNFKTAKNQALWRSSCRSQSIKTWLPKKIIEASRKSASSIFSASHSLRIALANLFKDTFHTILSKYEAMCKGGKKISQKDRMDLQIHFQNTVKNFKFGNYRTALKNKIQKSAQDIFDELIVRLDNKKFDYCSCNLFFYRIGAVGIVLTNRANKGCRAKCPNWRAERKKRRRQLIAKKRAKRKKKRVARRNRIRRRRATRRHQRQKRIKAKRAAKQKRRAARRNRIRRRRAARRSRRNLRRRRRSVLATDPVILEISSLGNPFGIEAVISENKADNYDKTNIIKE
eukprot:gene2210-2384_t